MTINVYWTCLEDEWMMAKEPVSMRKKFFSIKPPDNNNILRQTSICPAINNSFKNLYGISSIYDYQFDIIDNNVYSPMYNQEFMHKHLVIRDIEQKFFSFHQKYIFFTDEKSLLLTSSMFPFMEDHELSKSSWPVPGTFDIGKWFRSIEFPFYLREDCNSFKLSREDIMFYIQFHTQERIKFIKFVPTEKIFFFINSCVKSAQGKKRPDSMQYYYNSFYYQKNIIKEIKNNICGDK